MQSNWTRAHDAHIARECEGLEVTDRYGTEWHEMRAGRPWKPVDTYFTDPAAAIRAAEAWRKKAEGRYYETRSAMSDSFGDRPTSACCFHRHSLIAGAGETLAEALYNATGGPA